MLVSIQVASGYSILRRHGTWSLGEKFAVDSVDTVWGNVYRTHR